MKRTQIHFFRTRTSNSLYIWQIFDSLVQLLLVYKQFNKIKTFLQAYVKEHFIPDL